jgi:hypothetical protein
MHTHARINDEQVRHTLLVLSFGKERGKCFSKFNVHIENVSVSLVCIAQLTDGSSITFVSDPAEADECSQLGCFCSK